MQQELVDVEQTTAPPRLDLVDQTGELRVVLLLDQRNAGHSVSILSSLRGARGATKQPAAARAASIGGSLAMTTVLPTCRDLRYAGRRRRRPRPRSRRTPCCARRSAIFWA